MERKRIITDDPTVVEQVQKAGELPIEVNGVQLVLMTVDARQELQKVVYDDSEWTKEEIRAAITPWFDDPDGWAAPGMDVYDELYGDNQPGS